MRSPRLEVVREPTDPVLHAPPVEWALERLRGAFAARGGSARIVDAPSGDAATVHLLGGGPPPPFVDLGPDEIRMPEEAESFVLVPARSPGGPSLAVRGSDTRGLVYALLELSDRIEHAGDALRALTISRPEIEQPANEVRSVTRLFCSDVEDLGWFRDQGFWERYLTMVATQRFNRFSLTLGLGYNYHRDVTDAYLYFAYPFLVDVPGYDVRVPQLDEAEREQNLEMLRFIADQAVARGLDFQLGLWTHAYEWIESPNAHHTIEGLTPQTHAPYCRDAIRALLESCPSISGVTLRVHGESGVPEGSWDFWRSVFDGVASCGRRVGIDLHAKGLDRPTLSAALDTGLPITVSTKFWAEHMGLPYHQAAIRENERVVRDDPSHRSEWHRYMKVSEGSRPFTRYGYGDFFREDRPYDLVFRLWAGTQRVLLWGDPAIAAGYGRVAHLAGAQGLEWCEPLTFKGREGSGRPGSRTGYADPSLIPDDDWEKFAYTYRLFGRLTYDPEASPTGWRRPLPAHFGSAAPAAEEALANASRILPLVTVAHHPSASNNYYWPEVYTDMPIVWSSEGIRPHPYLDTPVPRRFGTVDPLDPEVFSSVADAVVEALEGAPSGRVSPVEVAAWLERLATETERQLGTVRDRARRLDAEARRWIVDVSILAALGRFFAGKLRAAVDYELYSETGSRLALGTAVEAYRGARDAWVDAVERSRGVYVEDLTYGPQDRIRGQWADRLPAIEADLHDMEAVLAGVDASPDADERVRDLTGAAWRARPRVEVLHTPPERFAPGSDLSVSIALTGPGAEGVRAVTLRYRPMDQALRFEAVPMERAGEGWTGRIDGGRLDGTYPLVYAFELRDDAGSAWRFPTLGDHLASQPYVVVRAEEVGGEPSPETL